MATASAPCSSARRNKSSLCSAPFSRMSSEQARTSIPTSPPKMEKIVCSLQLVSSTTSCKNPAKMVSVLAPKRSNCDPTRKEWITVGHFLPIRSIPSKQATTKMMTASILLPRSAQASFCRTISMSTTNLLQVVKVCYNMIIITY